MGGEAVAGMVDGERKMCMDGGEGAGSLDGCAGCWLCASLSASPPGELHTEHGGEEQILELCLLLQRDIVQVTKFPMASVSGSVKWGCRGVPGYTLECLEQCLAQSGNGSSLLV